MNAGPASELIIEGRITEFIFKCTLGGSFRALVWAVNCVCCTMGPREQHSGLFLRVVRHGVRIVSLAVNRAH